MPRRRMTRAESQARTRAELVRAAAAVFDRYGYSGASIALIAQEAGFTHGAVYSNFEGKEDLFLALYEQWVAERVAEIEEVWSSEGPIADRARAAADQWIEHFRSDPRAFLLRLEFAVRGAHDPELAERLGTRVGAVPLAIRRLVEEQVQQEGTAVSGAEQLASGLQALSLGLALEVLSNPDAVPPGLAGELAARMVESFAVRGAGRR